MERMGSFVEFMESLHPNALVAWDKAGYDLPDQLQMVFYKWDTGIWYTRHNQDRRNDGLGAITFKNKDNQFNAKRFILHYDDNPLGVSWFTDELA